MLEDWETCNFVGRGAAGRVKLQIKEARVKEELYVCYVGDVCRCLVRLQRNSCNARSAAM